MTPLLLTFAILGIVLMLLGWVGIWFAMNSPVQLQPIPAIAFAAGLLLFVFSMGGALL